MMLQDLLLIAVATLIVAQQDPQDLVRTINLAFNSFITVILCLRTNCNSKNV